MMIADQVGARGIRKYLLGVVFFCFMFINHGYAADCKAPFVSDGKGGCKRLATTKTCPDGSIVNAFSPCPDKLPPPTPPCSPGKEKISGKCVSTCSLGQTRGSNGLCTTKDNYVNCNGDLKCEELQRSLRESGRSVSDEEKLANCLKIYSDKYCNCKLELKGIYLNTEVPFVGHPKNKRCLDMDDAASAPTTVLQSLTKILMTFVMIGGFGMIVWAGMLMASSGSDEKRFNQGKDILVGVVIAFALLGSLGVILRLINPNFFT